MSDIAIKFENISKQYRLGLIGTGTILHDINRWWYTARGKEDPYLKIGDVNDRASKADSKYVWALKDITFDVKQGEVVGIIGKNGAGKSTLLKILSRVTSPTTGSIKAKGRIASLLEVGTGFHPELTGRENIFMNGSIMGMTKAEIKSKMDEIVDFAGIERYIDTPVKRYSSGMTVRLGFAIAAHLEPEILVVDEVLAVGDAEFQKKAIGKMQDVSRGEGRTVLFVSHNLNAVANLCNRGIVLKDGGLFFDGSCYDAIDAYTRERNTMKSYNLKILRENKDAWFTGFRVLNENMEEYSESMSVCHFEIEIESTREISGINIGIGINDTREVRLFTLFSDFFRKSYDLKKGINKMVCTVESLPLKPGEYMVELFLGTSHVTLDYYKEPLFIEILNSKNIGNLVLPTASQGHFIINQKWG
ncbi:ABC transporter ATP-binding protein [Bacteroidia bacterium]|nr:ABC transporter ATP-binding protein [Bacteroidia bacterium]